MREQQWYVAPHGNQIGPIPRSEVESMLRNGSIDGDTHVFSAGLRGWTRLGDVADLADALAPAGTELVPSPPGRTSHEIDFRIEGTEMQFVEVTLDPGESAVAEAGAMMFMTSGIRMETVFGDGSERGQAGIVGTLLGAGKRLLTGESLFMTVFTNDGPGMHRVAFTAPYAGKILPMDLATLGGELICQRDAFLCAAKGVSIGIAFQKRIGVGLFGGEGFIMQRLEGDGLTFVHAGGTVQLIELDAGETLRVDTGCLVALEPSVRYEVQFVAGSRPRCSGARASSSRRSPAPGASGCSRSP